MPLLRCIRKCYYGEKLWEVGEILETKLDKHPHFEVIDPVKDARPTPTFSLPPSHPDGVSAEPSLLTPTAEERRALTARDRENKNRAMAGEAVALSELTPTGTEEVDPKTLSEADKGLID